MITPSIAALHDPARRGFTPGWPGRVAFAVPLGVYLFVWPFGLGLLALGWLPPGAGWVGGVLLGAQGLAWTAWLALQVGAVRAGVVAAGIATGAWALEALGVTTGVPFGPYVYTPALGPTLGPVPLAIPFAWVASVGSATFLAGRLLADGPIRRLTLSTIIVGAALATALDLILEPVATRVQGYWTWGTAPGALGALYEGIPTANFVTWFVAALVLGVGIAAVTRGRLPHPLAYAWLPGLLYGLNVVMFGVVNATHGFWGPTALAAGLGAGLLLILTGRQRATSAKERSRVESR